MYLVRLYICNTLLTHVDEHIFVQLRASEMALKMILSFEKNNASTAICNDRYIQITKQKKWPTKGDGGGRLSCLPS